MKKTISHRKSRKISKTTSHHPLHSLELKKYVEHHLKEKHKNVINLFFSFFAKRVSDIVGNPWSFIIAFLTVIIWAVSGYYFNYSNTWQLIINTGTTIITFLMVFLIQNTQNRDTEILNLKIDELIRANKEARNKVINLNELSDDELKELKEEYMKLKNKRTGV